MERGEGTARGEAGRRFDAEADTVMPANASSVAAGFDPEGDTALPSELASARAASLTESTAVSAQSAISPSELMASDEIRRMRFYLWVITAFFAMLLVAMPIIGGDPTARWAASAGLLVYGSVCAWFVVVTRDPGKYTFKYMIPVVATGVPGGYLEVYYFGLFSPAMVAIGMILYFYCLVGSRAFAFSIWLSCALAQAALSGLIMGGIIEDRGLITAGSLSLPAQVLIQLLVQAVLFFIFLIARLSRRSNQDSIEQLEAAVRAVAHRDAMLREARQEIYRALRVGGPGRFTTQTLGSFKLGAILGRGAMGEVYEATNTSTGERAAVKLLHQHLLDSSDNLARFLREAQAASALQVPNVVRILEVGAEEEPVPFIAMERLDGQDLANLLRVRGRLDAGTIVGLMRQVARGLDAAAAAGIVHRDIKPHNIFLSEVGDIGEWKILDFGLSKLAGHDGTLTRGHVLGTPAYMAPEQARGESIDHRADVYSLAAIAYRAVTGHPPFSGDDLWAILGDVVNKTARRPAELCVTVNEDIERVLAIGLAKSPDDRFDSAGALAGAFAAAVDETLPDDLRWRAADLLATQPWGQRQ